MIITIVTVLTSFFEGWEYVWYFMASPKLLQLEADELDVGTFNGSLSFGGWLLHEHTSNLIYKIVIKTVCHDIVMAL